MAEASFEPPLAASYKNGNLWEDKVKTGEVTILIRNGAWKYVAGRRLIIVGQNNGWSAHADITNVQIKQFGDVTNEEAVAYGLEDLDAWKAEARYVWGQPDISPTALVTVITFALI